jgi:hypothetical protein
MANIGRHKNALMKLTKILVGSGLPESSDIGYICNIYVSISAPSFEYIARIATLSYQGITTHISHVQHLTRRHVGWDHTIEVDIS